MDWEGEYEEKVLRFLEGRGYVRVSKLLNELGLNSTRNTGFYTFCNKLEKLGKVRQVRSDEGGDQIKYITSDVGTTGLGLTERSGTELDTIVQDFKLKLEALLEKERLAAQRTLSEKIKDFFK